MMTTINQKSTKYRVNKTDLMRGNYNSVQCCNRKFVPFVEFFLNQWFYKIGGNIYKLCIFQSKQIELDVI